ncbi:MAG: O-methyltransferase [Ignavibacteriaceae bacterium]
MDKILFEVQKNYIKSFRKENDALILEMEEYARQNNIPILSWDSAEFLEQLINILNPKRVLEIGTAIAYSSIRMAKNLRKKGIVHTIEKSPENVEVAEDFIARSGVEDKIKILTGEALDVMPKLEKKYDLIFLDADKNDYGRLFDYSLILLKKGGVIFIDNLLWHGYAAANKVPASYKKSTKNIKEFNSVFMNHKALKTSLLPIGDGIGLGIKL